jgi:hypothetical protein
MGIRGNRGYEIIGESESATSGSSEEIRPSDSILESSRSDLKGLKGVSQTEARFNPRAVTNNPLFVYNPGLDRKSARVHPMASAGNGGEKGGPGEAPTRPK